MVHGKLAWFSLTWLLQMAGGPVAIRYTARDALPSQATGGIAVFVTGELAQGATVRLNTLHFEQFSCAWRRFEPLVAVNTPAFPVSGFVHAVPHTLWWFVRSQ
jgi:hypothetical protein